MDASQNAAGLRRTLDEALAAHDQPGAVLAALQAVANGSVDVTTLYTQVLGPLLTDTGASWRDGTTRVWQEHLASATVRIVVDALFPQVHAAAQRLPRRGVAVLACPSEELHDLGLRMLADRLALAGWEPRFLGQDTPATEVAAAAQALDAQLVVLSASTHFERVRLRDDVARLRELLPGTRVVVGGAAFECDRESWDDGDFLADADLAPPPRPAAEEG